MFTTNLRAVAHQSCQRFNVGRLAGPVAFQDSFGIRVTAGIHAAIRVEFDALLFELVLEEPKSLGKILFGPRLAIEGAEDWPFASHVTTGEFDNVGIGNPNDTKPLCLRFIGLKLPLHPVAMIGDVSLGELDKLFAESGPGANTNTNGHRQRRVGMFQQHLLLLWRDVGHSPLWWRSVVTLDGVGRNDGTLYAVVECPLHSLDARPATAGPGRVSIQPFVDVQLGQVNRRQGAVAFVNASAFGLELGIGRLLLFATAELGLRRVVAILGWDTVAKVVQRIGPVRVRLRAIG